MNKKQKFIQSNKSTNDYMNLLVTFKSVISPGDGLLWSTVEEVINDVINPRKSLES